MLERNNAPTLRRTCLFGIVASCIGAAVSAARAGYTAVDLYALKAPPEFPTVWGYQVAVNAIQAAAGDQVVGLDEYNSGGNLTIPLLWTHSSPVELTPRNLPLGSSFAVGTDGSQQVGYGGQHALLWTGTANSMVDLNPTGLSGITNSVAWGVSRGQQVGMGYGGPIVSHALLWNGTAASAVDLHPAGYTFSEAFGTNGTSQIGDGTGASFRHALLWRGSAESVVDLNPTHLPINMTIGVGISPDGTQQVGYGWDSSGFGQNHALVWQGTGDSAVDLQPQNLSGIDASRAFGTNGRQQVGIGYKWVNSSAPDQTLIHALVWSGTADSVVDLQTALPSGFVYSKAFTIDAAGDAFGVALDSDHLLHAIEWLPRPQQPGDINLDGSVGFDDLLQLAQHYGQNGSFIDGDLNGNGKVDFGDLLIVAQNYGQTVSQTGAASPIPDPCLLVLTLAAFRSMRTRRA